MDNRRAGTVFPQAGSRRSGLLKDAERRRGKKKGPTGVEPISLYLASALRLMLARFVLLAGLLLLTRLLATTLLLLLTGLLPALLLLAGLVLILLVHRTLHMLEGLA